MTLVCTTDIKFYRTCCERNLVNYKAYPILEVKPCSVIIRQSLLFGPNIRHVYLALLCLELVAYDR